jgi:hypothetical protein
MLCAPTFPPLHVPGPQTPCSCPLPLGGPGDMHCPSPETTHGCCLSVAEDPQLLAFMSWSPTRTLFPGESTHAGTHVYTYAQAHTCAYHTHRYPHVPTYSYTRMQTHLLLHFLGSPRLLSVPASHRTLHKLTGRCLAPLQMPPAPQPPGACWPHFPLKQL